MPTKSVLSDPLLTEQQAAEKLDLKPTTLQVWRVSKRFIAELPHVKIGRNVRYRASAIEAFITSQTVSA